MESSVSDATARSTEMRKRSFYSDSIIAGIAALVFNFGMQVCSIPRSQFLDRAANLLALLAIVFTIISLVCLITASIRRERTRYTIPIVLLVVDLIVATLLV